MLTTCQFGSENPGSRRPNGAPRGAIGQFDNPTVARSGSGRRAFGMLPLRYPMKHRSTSLTVWSPLALTLLAASSYCSPAQACGGLFCSAANPVNQAAERIIFADNGDDSITAVIEIQYQGPSEEFAWVLPLPAGDIEVQVSSKLALDRLQVQSNPQYNLQIVSNCGSSRQTANTAGVLAPGAAFGADDASAGGGVAVLEEGTAGPYDYQLIEVDDSLDDPADVAVDWLERNEYDVSALGPDLLRPYLEDNMNLLAFRLSKGKDEGSVRPVMITYEGTQASIPIRPTAVAAEDDMGVMVWVLGQSRAIPENYLHLELNEALIDWFNPDDTYNDVVTAAADDAGGQGFVTEQAGPAANFSESLFASWEDATWEYMKTGSFGTLQEFMEQAVYSFAGYDGLMDVLSDPKIVPLREGATPEQFASCVSCYFEQDVPVRNDAYPSTEFDPTTDPLPNMDVRAFLDEFERLVIAPMADTRALFDDNATVTRFYTTMSADEMTEDPFFDFNPELGDFSNVHTAQQILECDGGSEWRIVLDQGAVVEGTGSAWPVTLASTEMPVNRRILQMSTSGDGMVLEDNDEDIIASLQAMDVGGEPTESDVGVASGDDDWRSRSGGSCGVSPSGANTVAEPWWLVGLALMCRRRARQPKRSA